MKLIAEDVKNQSDDNESDVLRNSDSTTKVKWKKESDGDKNDSPGEVEESVEDNSIMSAYHGGKEVVMRRKEDMERTAAMMDALIQGVTKCHIGGEGEGRKASQKKVNGEEDDDSELTGKLSKLSIEAKEIPNKRQETKEDDERGSNRSSESEGEEINGQPPRVRLVKLEPPVPSKESKEDDKDSEEIITRGPAGIPVYHNRTGMNNFCGKSVILQQQQQQQLQQQQMPLMPDNFPNYQRQQQHMYNGMGGHVPVAAMGKRCMEPQDLYPEAPKYVRPQEMPIIPMPQNNLNAPGMPLPTNNASAAMPLSPTSFRPHSTVNVNQMAGGTVFAAEQQLENPPAMCQLPHPSSSHTAMTSVGWNQQQQQCLPYTAHDSPFGTLGNNSNDFLEDAVNAEEEGRVNSEEIERLLFNAANQLKCDSARDKDVENLLFSNCSNYNTTTPLSVSSSTPQQMTSVPKPTRAFSNGPEGVSDLMWQQGPLMMTTFQDKQQQLYVQQQSHLNNFYVPTTTPTPANGYTTNPMKQPSPHHRNSLEDMGYATDQSPSHESSQFSPSPSSIMAASPASSHISTSPPHHQNWSPPPSNMSQDSGVASPMSEDSKSYGQIKSPRSVRSITEMASPPHQLSQINMASPTGFFLPPTQQSPALSDISSHCPGFMPPLDLPQLDFTEDPNYKDSYIDANLPALELAVEVTDTFVKEDLGMSKIRSQLMPQSDHQPLLQQVVNNVSEPALVQQRTVIPPGTVVNKNSNIVSAGQLPPSVPSVTIQQGMGMVPIPHKQQVAAVVTNGNFIGSGHGHNKTTVVTAPVVTTISAGRIMPSTTGAAIISFPQTSLPFTSTTPVGQAGQAAPPIVNKDGKVQIPPNNPKVQPMANTMVAIVMAPSKPRFQPIAPKDPTKQNCCPVSSSTVNGNDSASSSYVSNNGVATTTAGGSGRVAASSGNRGQGGRAAAPASTRPSPETILNQARRFVADRRSEEFYTTDEEGDTILHNATMHSDGTYLVKALLERLEREDLISLINTQNNNGQTSLYLAVKINDHGKVKVLVEYGADVTVYADYNGGLERKAAIHAASSNGHTYILSLKALLAAPGINVEQLDSQGHTALHCAILSHGKNTVVPKKNKSDETIKVDSLPIIKALVAAGANPNLQVQNGRTALMMALETGCLDLFETLVSLVNPAEREKCLKTQDFKGNSVLKIAERLKGTLELEENKRLQNCLKRNAFQRNSGSGS